MMNLYGNGQSRSFRALWALEEAKIPYNYHHVEFESEQNPYGALSREYKNLNCQGKVPTIVDGDLVITESAAILNYVSACSPSARLAPIYDTPLKVKFDEICFFVLSDLEQPVSSIGKHRFGLPRERRIPDMLETSVWEFNRSLTALKQYLTENEYLVGKSFTIADILVAHTLNLATFFGLDMPEIFSSYKDRMYKRPACQTALEVSKNHC